MLESPARAGSTPSPPPRRPGAPRARELLTALRDGAPIDARTCVVVAHPDDETLGLGARLASFRRLELVHLTDGAPSDPRDAARAGFADAEGYRQARSSELAQALATLGVAPWRVALGVRDQDAAHRLAWIARSLAPLLASCEIVVSHAYEGGHPDHDAAAFAVQAACAVLARHGRRAPLRLEFAGYHLARGLRVTGAFWPDPARPAVTARIAPDALARKRQALAAFRSQAQVIAWFREDLEAYRQAPVYDQWGWALTSEQWRTQAAAARTELEAAPWA